MFDGQLWVKLDLHAFPNIPPPALARLAKVAGTFVRELDLRGHTDLESSTLQEITSHREKAREGVLAVEFHPGLPVMASAGADGSVKLYASS